MLMATRFSASMTLPRNAPASALVRGVIIVPAQQCKRAAPKVGCAPCMHMLTMGTYSGSPASEEVYMHPVAPRTTVECDTSRTACKGSQCVALGG